MSTDPSTEIEYELTFLPRSMPPGLSDAPSVQVVDFYFPSNLSVHPRLRLRHAGHRFSLTRKQPLDPENASVQSEQAIELSESEFREIAAASSRSVSKRRYTIRLEGYQCEVDVFSGRLRGLVLLDFEFESAQQLDAFQPPDICLADVTQEPAIAGGLLAGRGFSEIQAVLHHYGYAKLDS